MAASINGTGTAFENSLIASAPAIYTTLAALVTIDAFYDATPSSTILTAVATATSGINYHSATELHNLGYSDPNVWSILGAGWGADQNSSFYALYSVDAAGTTAGYTAFINAAYQQEFGITPTAANLQNLLADIPGLTELLSGGGNATTPIEVMGGLFGYLLYAGQVNEIGHYAGAADAFLQAVANGTAIYGPELTQQFAMANGGAGNQGTAAGAVYNDNGYFEDTLGGGATPAVATSINTYNNLSSFARIDITQAGASGSLVIGAQAGGQGWDSL